MTNLSIFKWNFVLIAIMAQVQRNSVKSKLEWFSGKRLVFQAKASKFFSLSLSKMKLRGVAA